MPNVLYPATLRDMLLSLARDGLYHARSSNRIRHEMVRGVIAQHPESNIGSANEKH
jgi:hypothetical protein